MAPRPPARYWYATVGPNSFAVPPSHIARHQEPPRTPPDPAHGGTACKSVRNRLVGRADGVAASADVSSLGRADKGSQPQSPFSVAVSIASGRISAASGRRGPVRVPAGLAVAFVTAGIAGTLASLPSLPQLRDGVRPRMGDQVSFAPDAAISRPLCGCSLLLRSRQIRPTTIG